MDFLENQIIRTIEDPNDPAKNNPKDFCKLKM